MKLTRSEAADYLTAKGFKIANATLAKYASVGGGPKYCKFGKKVLYSVSDLTEWADSKITIPEVKS